MVMQPIEGARARTRVIHPGKVHPMRQQRQGDPMPTRVVAQPVGYAPARIGAPAPPVARQVAPKGEDGMIAGLLIAPWIIALVLVLSYILFL